MGTYIASWATAKCAIAAAATARVILTLIMLMVEWVAITSD